MAEKQLLVRLLCHTPAPEQAVALGGRLCYSDDRAAIYGYGPKERKICGEADQHGAFIPH